MFKNASFTYFLQMRHEYKTVILPPVKFDAVLFQVVARAVGAVGHLCMGDASPEMLDAAVGGLFEQNNHKAEEVQFAIGEALCFIFGGTNPYFAFAWELSICQRSLCCNVIVLAWVYSRKILDRPENLLIGPISSRKVSILVIYGRNPRQGFSRCGPSRPKYFTSQILPA